ncbi:hypothetical protein HZS_2959 [Henneguya salminicola]|nr:hypothetical protein HZS_2959 [Henneguya salminicola]
MIMNGHYLFFRFLRNNMRVGCVGSLRNIKDAIGVAYDIMMKTKHSFLVGSEATEFAVKLGYKFENVSSKTSKKEYSEWKSNNCEPNYWNVVVYYKISLSPKALDKGHDTIGFVSLDLNGLMAAATSTNGMKFKIPGRIGDSPIPGAGSYVNSKIGGAAATGDGDVLMRFMPSYQAVEFLSQGLSPNQAASMALKRIIEFEKYFSGAIVVLSKSGEHGASSFGFDNFSYYYASDIIQSPILISVTPMST